MADTEWPNVIVVDEVGLVARVTPSYAQRALARGEVEPDDRDGVLRVIPVRLRERKQRTRRQWGAH